MRNELAHVLADIVDRLVAMIDEILPPDHRNDSIAGVVPFGRKPLAVAQFDEIIRGEDPSRHHEAAEDGFVGFRTPGLDRHADRNRRPLALLIDEAEADVGPGLLALALVLAQRSQAIVDHAPLRGASALAFVARHGVEALHIAVAAGENDLRHVENGRFAGSVFSEHAGMSGQLDVLDIEQVPIDHGDMAQFHHASSPPVAGTPTSWERTKRSIRSSASEPLISLIIGRIATSMSWASLSNSPISTRLRCDASLRISRNRGSDIAFDPLA